MGSHRNGESSGWWVVSFISPQVVFSPGRGGMFEMRWWGVKGSFENIFHKTTSKG